MIRLAICYDRVHEPVMPRDIADRILAAIQWLVTPRTKGRHQ